LNVARQSCKKRFFFTTTPGHTAEAITRFGWTLFLTSQRQIFIALFLSKRVWEETITRMTRHCSKPCANGYRGTTTSDARRDLILPQVGRKLGENNTCNVCIT